MLCVWKLIYSNILVLIREDSDRVFIIAEMSANHNHDFNIAVETVKAAKAAGADAIKFQTYTADTLTLDCDNAYFQIKQRYFMGWNYIV